MQKPTILELRGTGVLVRTFLISDAELTHLTELTEQYDEPLEAAWFDPAFRWKESVREVLDNLRVVSEHRGLFADSRSFLEVRQFRKTRRKFTMNKLLQTEQLFPLVKSSEFRLPEIRKGQNLLLEITHGIGCLGRFELPGFNLNELELSIFKLRSLNQEMVLFTAYFDKEMMCLKDDFLVRGSELLKLFPSHIT